MKKSKKRMNFPTCTKRFLLHKNNNNNNNNGVEFFGGVGRVGQLLFVLRSYISVALQQKTANFKVARACSVMQWSVQTEEKQKNQFAQNRVIIIIKMIISRGNYSSSFASTSALH